MSKNTHSEKAKIPKWIVRPLRIQWLIKSLRGGPNHFRLFIHLGEKDINVYIYRNIGNNQTIIKFQSLFFFLEFFFLDL